MQVLQHLRCTNDRNGNPRRIWAIYDVSPEGVLRGPEESGVSYRDEGYGGKPKDLRGLPELPCVDITISEYRTLKRFCR